jgi:ABC-type transport system involved in multi-copper enzyme maturation permease subunit
MLARVGVVALNTYREAVRARILHGLFGLAVATAAYAIVVGAFAVRDTLRVVSDLGAGSISVYGIIVAVVLSATSLYRELELKTVFPILARPIARHEYLVGKYLGIVLTLAVFIAANSALVMLALAVLAGRSVAIVGAAGASATVAAAVLAWRVPARRTIVPIVWSVVMLCVAAVLCSGAPDDRRVVLGAGALTLCEVSIVAAIATVFAAFSSPFLTAVFTFGVFVVGRSADTLARLPKRVFGEVIHGVSTLLAKVVPNLMVYVPPRPLLTGEAMDSQLGTYLLLAAAQAAAWSVALLALASLVFRKRDFL